MTRPCLLSNHQRDDEFIAGHLIIRDALDHQLEPVGGSLGGVNSLKCGLLLTNVHLILHPPPWTSPGILAFPQPGFCGCHPLSALHSGLVCVGFGNHPPMHCPH